MDENNKLIAETILKTLDSGGGIVSKLFSHYQSKYALSDQYLAEQIFKNHKFTMEDINVAGQLYGLSKLRRHYKNVSKIIYSADNMANMKNITEADIDEDWLDYFLDRAEKVSDESVQNIFAYILANKCENKDGFKKVMLDRMALLDRDSAETFLKLCQVTYEVETSDGLTYSVPFYIRDVVLKKMVDCDEIQLKEDEAITYQSIRPDESALELLQEIGFIKLSEDFDESDIYSSEKISFEISINDKHYYYPAIYDSKDGIYYAITGCCVYTSMGLELYNAIKNAYRPYEQFFNLICNYYEYQKLVNSETD